MIKFLQLNKNIAGCLQNCTGHGICKISNLDLSDVFCDCEPNFYGQSCEYDRRICQISRPCLGTGKCIDVYNQTTLNYDYICQLHNITNITCPVNSILKSENLCECKYLYTGENCEIESEILKVIRIVKKSSSIVAYFILTFLFFLLVLNDLIELCCRNRNIKKRKQIIYKFKYHN